MEYNIRLKNGLILRGMLQSPGVNTHGMIIFIHGLGEHIKRYSSWADLFNKEGFGFTGVDLPGHGRSDGQRGNIKSYSVTDEMIDILLDSTRKTFPGIPVFLYGHSLGGGIVIDYLLRKNPALRGAIVTSPWLRLAFEPPKFKILMASVLKNIIPGMTQPSGLEVNHLSKDRMVAEAYVADPLIHDKVSVSLFHSAMKASTNALKNSHALKTDLLLMHGSDDMICSPGGSCEFASGTHMAELKIWDGGFHELHNEPDKLDVFQYIINWITKITK